MGAAKLSLYLKSLSMQKVFWEWEILGRGYKRTVEERKIENLQTEVRQKILRYQTEISRGGRHLSYATAFKKYQYYGATPIKTPDRSIITFL